MRKSVATLFAALVVLSAVVPMAAVAQETTTADSGTDLEPYNPGADASQNPYIEVGVTKQTHNMSEMGTGAEGVLMYYDDQGDLATLNASLNESADNPVTYTPTHVDADDFGAFPVDKENVSALDAGEWTTDESGTAGTVSVSNVEVASGVGAVSIAATGQSSGDTGRATFDNFSVTSDEVKRYGAIGADVDTLGSSTEAEVRFVDEDGDYKAFTVNASADASNPTVLASSTGDGYVTQAQFGQVATEGSGDGTFNNIESVTVVVMDGNLGMEVSILNAERMSPYTFGDRAVDNDGDDEMETETLEGAQGDVSIKGLDTLGNTFNDAEIAGLTFNAEFAASDLPEEDRQAMAEDATDYSWPWKVTEYNRLKLPTAYELSYTSPELKADVALPGSRYISVEYAEGTGDTDFTDVSDSSYTAVTGDFATKGATVTLDQTVQPGQAIVFKSVSVVSDDQKSAMFTLPASGGAGGILGGGSGGLFSGIGAQISGVIAAVLGWLGLKSRSGGS